MGQTHIWILKAAQQNSKFRHGDICIHAESGSNEETVFTYAMNRENAIVALDTSRTFICTLQKCH